jgi:hypothetical protein
MKVRELIAELQKYDPEANVEVQEDYYQSSIDSVKSHNFFASMSNQLVKEVILNARTDDE